MKIKDVMTKKPIAMRPNDTLHDLIKILVKHKISGCPVINKNKEIVGIVTQTDIIRMIDVFSDIQKGDDIFLILSSLLKSKNEILSKEIKKIKTKKLKEFMKKDVITIDVNDDFYKAARLINKYNIDRLPVTKNKKLVGILTKKDIMKELEKIG
ncbi:MAG: CBS domain-containing protein [Candidatus Aenigmatarchaeota archaeon]